MGFEDSSLTPSACGMLQILSARLMQLKELLAENLFNKAWHSLATQFSQVSKIIIKHSIMWFLQFSHLSVFNGRACYGELVQFGRWTTAAVRPHSRPVSTLWPIYSQTR
jgi:hypothetical protein